MAYGLFWETGKGLPLLGLHDDGAVGAIDGRDCEGCAAGFSDAVGCEGDVVRDGGVEEAIWGICVVGALTDGELVGERGCDNGRGEEGWE
jgi:hypothetical protein